SQKELAAEVGCSSRRLSDYEYGERPIPLAELEVMAGRLGLPLEHFLDEEGSIGEWHRQQRIWQRFLELPPEIQEFVVRPANIKYLEIAAELERMSVDRLRAIAEGLLDITY
ncbi:MAG TPA: XRE family transcriptional regulator, partial [Chloroflexi bacterium]|nr:XRE family transcriptional regulator [Chloroflexota bacterium]